MISPSKSDKSIQLWNGSSVSLPVHVVCFPITRISRYLLVKLWEWIDLLSAENTTEEFCQCKSYEFEAIISASAYHQHAIMPVLVRIYYFTLFPHFRYFLNSNICIPTSTCSRAKTPDLTCNWVNPARPFSHSLIRCPRWLRWLRYPEEPSGHIVHLPSIIRRIVRILAVAARARIAQTRKHAGQDKQRTDHH